MDKTIGYNTVLSLDQTPLLKHWNARTSSSTSVTVWSRTAAMNWSVVDTWKYMYVRTHQLSDEQKVNSLWYIWSLICNSVEIWCKQGCRRPQSLVRLGHTGSGHSAHAINVYLRAWTAASIAHRREHLKHTLFQLSCSQWTQVTEIHEVPLCSMLST